MWLTPGLRRQIVEPAWARWSGTPLLRAWRELEETQFLPAAVLREWQEERLRALISAACRDTPFYARRIAEAGVTPDEIRTVDDLRRLPIITKHEIRTRVSELRSRAVHASSLLEFRTGGSTGTPLVLFVTEDVSEQRNACARRSNRWTGWEVGEPVGAVWGNPKLPQTMKERLRWELLEPVIYLDTMAVTPQSVERFAREWQRVRPTLLFGHSHSLYLLARILADLGIEAIRPKGVISTSMMLLAPERNIMENVFGVRVFDRYGCEEVDLIGCECDRHTGMHINIDQLVVEFVREDGSPANAGETAYVVVTDLLNHAMPLIRYRIEDLAERLDERCACGRGLPLMSRVAGRVADFLVRHDGARVAGVSLIENSLTRFPGIEQMQLVQEELGRILVRVVPASDYAEATRQALLDYFATTFPGARIELELVERIAREPNGKYRFAICSIGE